MTKTKTTKTPVFPLGLGCEYEMDGDTMLLRLTLTGDFGKTKKGEGKNRKVCSSGGRQTVAGGAKANVNVYDEVPGREAVDLESLAPMVGVEWPLGTNIVGTLDESGVLHCRIDMGADFGATKSGKSRRIATTSGNTTIPGPLKVGINIEDPILTPGS